MGATFPPFVLVVRRRSISYLTPARLAIKDSATAASNKVFHNEADDGPNAYECDERKGKL